MKRNHSKQKRVTYHYLPFKVKGGNPRRVYTEEITLENDRYAGLWDNIDLHSESPSINAIEWEKEGSLCQSER